MPICTVHLLSLSCPLSIFLEKLSSANLHPLTIARVIRWIILPTSISVSSLLAQNIHWDVLLILPSSDPLPVPITALIGHHFTLEAGVPSRLLKDFSARNEKLLRPAQGDAPSLTGSLEKPRIAASSQALELSPELKAWVQKFSKGEGKGAVSMLNLLAFKEGMKENYLQYGKAFAEGVGSKRGGLAKIVGSVIHGKEADGEGWDELALAHYPSIMHFADMLASEDYQDANHKYRVNSLRDTCILCTTELYLSDDGQRSKL